MLRQFQDALQRNGEVYLHIKVRPHAARSEVKEILEDETIKIDVAAPPEKNKANEALLAFLAQEFVVPKNSVRIVSGAGERVKLVKIIT